MEYIVGTTEFSCEEDCAVTLGKFDSLHRGHQRLIRRVRQLQREGLKGVVFTLNSNKSEVLLTEEERRSLLEGQGLSCLIDCPFVPEISHMEPEAFVSRILVDRLHAKYLVVGTDFHFGYQRKGDYRLLQNLQDKYGFQVEVIHKKKYEGKEISSTFVKEELKKGNMGVVNELLGRPYGIIGEVLHGRKIGRTLGMPTTNLIPEKEKLLPPNGVYASKTVIDGKMYPGITNIGYKPTVGESFRGVETYIFDFDQDLYGKTIEILLYTFERPEMKFDSLEKLKECMHRDIEFGKEYFGEQ